ncbi:mechanosensitive ion channel-like protein [Mucilaginibacter oryzae]|uniref:Mechanosensitive ion channel-like protein n=1 Tax=Mucilaginibacter oryzae TaxID=468058 RepID=A0A316HGB9_9SPHI|nr:mechanosensitive ion channel domain-containing protein [Mucilaginibacter oryzae]PWK79050.1 mechanosensitive ion channel-like protein [Mucilaginibacter oryzae]
MPKIKKVATLSVLFVTLMFSLNASAQTKKKKTHSVRDSLRAAILARDSVMRSLKRSDTSVNNLLQKVEYYTSEFNQIKANLSKKLDTAEISAALPSYEKRITLIKSLIDNDKSSTLRYLYTIRDVLTRSDDQLDIWQEQLADINTKLTQNQNDLDAISRDSVLKILPADSSLATTYLIQKIAIDSKYHRLDTINKKVTVKIGLLQNRVSAVYISILDMKDQIDSKIRDFSERAVSQEYNNIWAMEADEGSDFGAATKATSDMNIKLFSFFIGRDVIIHLSGLVLLLAFFAWIRASRRKISRDNESSGDILSQANYVVKHPFVSSIIITFTLVPNFYNHPPVVVLETFLGILMVAILYLIKKVCPANMFRYMAAIFVVTFLYSLSNLYIQVTNIDRVTILLLALAASVISFSFLQKVNLDKDLYLPYSSLILKAFIFFQAVSFLCNVFGRVSLAKIIGVTSAYHLWLALAMYYIVHILMEALFLQLEAGKNSNNLTSFIDYKLLKNKFKSVLSVLVTILWLVMLTQNLSVEDTVFDFLGDFLTKNRSIGGTNTQFTFQSVIIFVTVIWLSSIASKIISYLYDVSARHANDLDVAKKKNRTSTLLIRIGVIALGFFLAVAASGVPIDKITIIISAFGIGIGFGLQNIVNNLVSGLILAFEKPIQVGDIIEVDSRSGTIMDIGIRASKIATSDGAEVIVPNGDLISHHVINWTLSNNNRRVDLIVGVAYGSNIQQVKEILFSLLQGHDDIMTEPAPSVLVHNLNESSVDFRILFWAADINTWVGLKSRVLADIYEVFAREGIEIPFRQQDVKIVWPDNLPPIKIEAPITRETKTEDRQDTTNPTNPPDQDQ